MPRPRPDKVASRWFFRQAQLRKLGCRLCVAASKTDHLLSLFHHIHHEDGEHEVHHCGGKHKDLPYTIEHCSCGKHRIDMEEAVGHGTQHGNDLLAVTVKFKEKCPDGGWHIESGGIVEHD